ncbi:rhamnosyltransferase [Kandleria vitulina]|uniref:Rhamnosyltransferase n=1 Tax=Kandleria vitulina TaxID=1630 RepID=A0A1H2TWA6_9FIRM|nr:glycosyltransferase [Kandleria vitulina]SDW48047.1 rhamnosyltransferase [Kandleria vitulina]
MNNKTCILISTYNGERYIEDQIKSLLAQSVDVDIFIRDDGSKDETVNIIKSIDSKNIYFIEDDAHNLGPACSFMELLYSVPDYEYYAFCDQDDVWEPDKIKSAINMIAKKNNKPMLYTSNQILYKNNAEIGMRFDEEPPHNFVSTIFGNHLSGCTMVFNRELKKYLCRKKSRPSNEILQLRMHDTWVALVANLFGEIIYDSNSYILYRIHDNNTIGLSRDSFLGKIKQYKKNMFNLKNMRSRYKVSKELLRCFPEMKTEDKDLLNILVKSTSGIHNKLRVLTNKRIRKEAHTNRLILFINVLMNWL